MSWRAIRERAEQESWEELQLKKLSENPTKDLRERRERIEARLRDLTAQFPEGSKRKDSPIYSELCQLELDRERIAIVLSRRGKPLALTSRPKRKTEKRDLIDAFIDRVNKDTGHKITRKDIWTVAGYTNATEFERYQRDADNATESAKRNFDRACAMRPVDFLQALDRKRLQRRA